MLNPGVYHGGASRFTRAVTGRATLAWVCGVFVLPDHRALRPRPLAGRDTARASGLAGLRGFMLAIAGAYQAYAGCGFAPLADPGRYMEVRRSPRDLYR